MKRVRSALVISHLWETPPPPHTKKSLSIYIHINIYENVAQQIKCDSAESTAICRQSHFLVPVQQWQGSPGSDLQPVMMMLILHTSRCAVGSETTVVSLVATCVFFPVYDDLPRTSDPPATSAMEVGGIFGVWPSENFPQQRACYKHMTFFGFWGQSRGVQKDPAFALNLHVPSWASPTPKLPQMQTSCSDSWKAGRPARISASTDSSARRVISSSVTCACASLSKGFQLQPVAAAPDVCGNWWRLERTQVQIEPPRELFVRWDAVSSGLQHRSLFVKF